MISLSKMILPKKIPISQSKYLFSSAPKPLQGIRVLDLSRILVGPYCTMFLADMGAEVIKLEPPEGDETRKWGPPFRGSDATYFFSVNRSKKNICVDIKKKEGLDLLYDLAKKSDVLVENFSPGVTTKLKIDYDTIKPLNPAIIYASVTAFGTEGPWAHKVGFDLVNQAVTGLMHITGEADGAPQKVGVAITDVVSALTLGNGIIAALFNRAQTGKGMKVETSLMESMVSALVNQWSGHLNGNVQPKRTGSLHGTISPCGAYQTRDGKWFTICCTDKQYVHLCEILGDEDLMKNPKFANNLSRIKNRDEVEGRLKAHFLRFDQEPLMKLFDEHKVPAGPVSTLKEVFSGEQVKAMEIVKSVDSKNYGELRMVRNPLRFDGGICDDIESPGRLGEKNAEVLKEILGYSEEKIKNLRREKVLFEQKSCNF